MTALGQHDTISHTVSMADLLESVVDDIWVLKVIVGEKVELVKEVSNIDATQRIHLRERQDTGKSSPH